MVTTDQEPKLVHDGEVVMVEKVREGKHGDGDEAHSEGQTIPSSAGADFSDEGTRSLGVISLRRI